jgi:ATP-dependent Clp protease protease subunit
MGYVIEDGENGEVTYEIYSRLLKDRIIFLQGEFNDVMANSIVSKLLYLQAINDKEDIYMYINSPGGQLTSANAIYDVMQYVKPDINTLGIGSVCSAGSFILAAGTKGKRASLKSTEIMIHELSGGTSGKANDMFQHMEHTKKQYERMAKQYASFTGKSLKTIKKDMQRDYFMTSDEALGYGLIDKIL